MFTLHKSLALFSSSISFISNHRSALLLIVEIFFKRLFPIYLMFFFSIRFIKMCVCMLFFSFSSYTQQCWRTHNFFQIEFPRLIRARSLIPPLLLSLGTYCGVYFMTVWWALSSTPTNRDWEICTRQTWRIIHFQWKQIIWRFFEHAGDEWKWGSRFFFFLRGRRCWSSIS